jgi:HEAT repeat protein
MGLFGPPNIEKLKAKKNVKGLIKALQYKNKGKVRRQAADALAVLGDVKAAEPLIHALKDEYVRWDAANALAKIGGPAVEPLIRALTNEDSNVRLGAARALGYIGNARAVEPLIHALKDEYVRWEAVACLGKIGDARAAEPLSLVLLNNADRIFSQMTDDQEDAVRRALSRIGEPAVEPLIQVLYKCAGARNPYSIIYALADLGEPAVEPLINALKDNDKDVRRGAAIALGEIGDVRAVEPLINALKDNDKRVRSEAVIALGEIGDVRAVEPLINALEDNDGNVRIGAVKALCKIGNIKTAEKVINYIFDRAEDIISSSVSVISRHRPDVKKMQNEWKSKFRSLFGDYTDLIIDTALYEIGTYRTHYGASGHTYSLDNTENATEKLCKIYTPISNNILHIIAKRKDIEVRIESKLSDDGGFNIGWFKDTLSFERLRKMTKKELEKRGKPLYDSSAYLKKENWKL